MLAADLFMVTTYGSYVPWLDDWGMVPALTGDQPIARWLWIPQNEHWVPLPKLILFGLLRLTACDFRGGMVANVLLLAVLAAGMMLAAREVRGHVSYTDAFFPLVLLHGGHAPNLLWCWQLTFILPTALAGGILIIIVRIPRTLPFGWIALGGTFLVLLPLCGANGLAMVPALSLWFLLLALDRWRLGSRQRILQALMILALVFVASLLAQRNAVGWERPANIPPSPSLARTLAATFQFCSTSLGPLPWPLWPACGLLVTALVSGGSLARGPNRAWIRGTPSGIRLASFSGAMASVAVAIGWGRAGLSPEAGLASRYVSLAAPWLCWIYFAALLAEGALGRWVTALLVIATGLMAVPNTSAGYDQARSRCNNMWYVKHDLEAGLPAEDLAARYSRAPFMLYPWEADLARYLIMLRRAAIGPYYKMHESRPRSR